MERQEYLQYFLNNKKKPCSKTIYQINKVDKQSRSLHTQSNKIDKKLLPHISQQYQYKITNQLLVQKIMNPKRDKLITQNFPKSVTRPATKQNKFRPEAINSVQKQIKSLHRDKNRKQYQQTMGALSLHQKIRIRRNLSRMRHQGIKSYQKQFNMALQNDRMGRRIVNTKSSVQQILKKTFYTYKSNSKSNKQVNKQNNDTDYLKCSYIKGQQNKRYYFSGKLNNGVKVFFNQVRQDQQSQINSLNKSRTLSQSQLVNNSSLKDQQYINGDNMKKNGGIKQYGMGQKEQQGCGMFRVRDENKRKIKTSQNYRNRFVEGLKSQNNADKPFQTHYPESFKIFGKGPTILMIHNLQIQCNPPIKESTLLLLELISHQKRINYRKNKQKTIRTVPICYDFFKNQPQNQFINCIRFAINVSQIGDFVPFRIYRVHGVQIQQLGIIDIDLAPFKYRKTQILFQQQNITQENKNYNITKQCKLNVMKEYKQNNQGIKLEREVISGKAEGQLRKNLLNKPVDISVKLNYKIYPKRFKSILYQK